MTLNNITRNNSIFSIQLNVKLICHNCDKLTKETITFATTWDLGTFGIFLICDFLLLLLFAFKLSARLSLHANLTEYIRFVYEKHITICVVTQESIICLTNIRQICSSLYILISEFLAWYNIT